jgi:predicted DNA-binding antitoxin AbrB/MazE fold protein
MSQTFTAIYEYGVLRPLIPLSLPDHTLLELTIQSDAAADLIDQDALQLAERDGDDSISLESVRRQLSSIQNSWAESIIADRGEY